MKHVILLLISFSISVTAFSQNQKVTWYDALDIGLWGQAWEELKHPYDRLPGKAVGVVRTPVWKLGTNTAGMSVHFKTNSPFIRVYWSVRYQNSMWHMTDCGIRGVDLYLKDGDKYFYAGSGNPGNGKSAERMLIDHLDGSMKSCIIHLPLYDGIDTLRIGIEEGALIENVTPDPNSKPVVIYGTSIQQGGCANRPGMAASNILSRQLDREFINLGFSGNGRMEMELAELLAEIDASAYILDCLPNLSYKDQIIPRTLAVVRFLKTKRPEVPIFLVEVPTPETARFDLSKDTVVTAKNQQLRLAFQELKNESITQLYLIPAKGLLGDDREGTVDGVHYTDVGFIRYSQVIESWLRKYAPIN